MPSGRATARALSPQIETLWVTRLSDEPPKAMGSGKFKTHSS